MLIFQTPPCFTAVIRICAADVDLPRAAADVQRVSHSNTWLHRSGNTDWVFGCDAWTVPLGEAERVRA